ncbi:MAG: hypothetical protein AB7P03_10900 [Kofleriaceae bacterium]
MEPSAATREQQLEVLGEFVSRGGAASLLAPPVEPGQATFPEPWAPTRSGVELLVRRLAWHAGLDRDIEIDDRRTGAAPTERKPATRLAFVEARRDVAVFALEFLGDDDVVGTFAHEIGVAYAVLHRANDDDPYRTIEPSTVTVDPERDLVRGSIAATYRGLGVLAANAAYQQHSVLERAGFHPLLVAPVAATVEAGHLPLASACYLVAVQAAVRGETRPPPGLVGVQHRQVASMLEELRGDQLRERLGIASDAIGEVRPVVEPFVDAQLAPDEEVRKTAFRWNTNRKGVGMIAGAVVGVVVAMLAAEAMMPILAIGSSFAGLVIGRFVRTPRCSACASVNAADANQCNKCRAVFRGEIASLSDRLEAEERLEDAT